MSYFYTQSHVQLQPYRGLGQKHQQIEGGAGMTRDQDIEREINKLAGQPSKFSELNDASKCQQGRRGIKTSAKPPGYTGDNVITEPAAHKPMMRVVPDRSDDELRSLMPKEGNPKLQAQQRMQASPGFVAKMTGHSTSPLTSPTKPVPHARAPAHLPGKNQGEAAPLGFKGMGMYCADSKMHGRRAPNQKDFEVPEYVPKRRTHGVKSSIAPKDTFVLG